MTARPSFVGRGGSSTTYFTSSRRSMMAWRVALVPSPRFSISTMSLPCE